MTSDPVSKPGAFSKGSCSNARMPQRYCAHLGYLGLDGRFRSGEAGVEVSGGWLAHRLPTAGWCSSTLAVAPGLSYRDVEELLAERGITVEHVTVYRWVQRFTPLFAAAARAPRHATGDRWFVDQTYVKVTGRGGTCTGRSTSTGRSSMSCCPISGHRGRPPVLHRCAGPWAGAGRGDYRQGRPAPAGP
jgi:hypothetical protein